MARRGGRRGGQGNRGRRSKANRSRNRSTKSSSRSKSTSSRRGGQGNKSRSTGRAKGTVSRKSVGKGLRSVAKAVGKVASKTKGFAGVGSIASAARAAANKVKQSRTDRSSKAARQQRRADRLKRQHGLDYSRMNDSFKANVNVSQAYKALGLDKNRLTRAVYNKLPKRVRDYSWKHQFKSPTKLGIRDGYKAPNRGGRSIPKQYQTNYKGSTVDSRAVGRTPRSIRSETPGGIGGFVGTGNWLDFYRPENQRRLRDQYTTGIDRYPGRRGQDTFGPDSRGLPRPIRGGIRPPRDTIAMMYENILGRKADQGGLDYWRSELESGRQSRDDIRQNIIKSDEFQGRSEADRQAALRGVEQRQSLRRQKFRRGKPPRQKHRGHWAPLAAAMAARGF